MTPPAAASGHSARTRVLWLIKGLDLGGAEQLLVHLARVRNQDEFEYEVAYVLEDRSALAAELEGMGIRVHCLRGSNDFDLRWALRLRRLLLSRDYDVIHLHLRYTATVGRLVAHSLGRVRRPRVVFTEHNVWGHDIWVTRFTNFLTLWMDDADIAVSHLVRNSIPGWMQGRMTVVVHGVPLAMVEDARLSSGTVREEFGIGAEEILIGTIANLRPQKGYDILLPAARALIDEGLPVRFLAVGHGPLATEIDELHTGLDLGDRLIMAGARNDALRLMAACDIFVLASHFEGFPVSVMEALALRLPVVATAVGGIPEAVTNRVEGLVVPPGHVDALVAALRELVLHPELRARMSAAALITGQRYDIQRAGAEIEDIYRRVLTGAR